MHRDLGQVGPAQGFLKQALVVATEVGEQPLRASVLTLLGTVLVASDGAAAITNLEEAVNLREDQVCVLVCLFVLGEVLTSISENITVTRECVLTHDLQTGNAAQQDSQDVSPECITAGTLM